MLWQGSNRCKHLYIALCDDDAFLTAGGSGIHRPLGRRQDAGSDYKSKVNKHNNLQLKWSCLSLHCHSECLFLTLTERKRRCEEKRKGGSLRLHPSEEGPAQSQVWASAHAITLICRLRLQPKVLLYAYRKRAKLHGQFKGMVRGVQKGAQSGKKMQKKKGKAWRRWLILFVGLLL